MLGGFVTEVQRGQVEIPLSFDHPVTTVPAKLPDTQIKLSSHSHHHDLNQTTTFTATGIDCVVWAMGLEAILTGLRKGFWTCLVRMWNMSTVSVAKAR